MAGSIGEVSDIRQAIWSGSAVRMGMTVEPDISQMLLSVMAE